MTNPLDALRNYPLGIDEALRRAQQLAHRTCEAVGVWEHVGSFGNASGDIPARHTYKVQSFSKPNPADDWALVATADPVESSEVQS